MKEAATVIVEVVDVAALPNLQGIVKVKELSQVFITNGNPVKFEFPESKWVGNGRYGSDENNLENAVICFKVEKSQA